MTSDWAGLESLGKHFAACLGQSADVVDIDVELCEKGVVSSGIVIAPATLPLSQDPSDAKVGMYQTYAINTIAPIRLAQSVIEYWLQPEHRHLAGNVLWIASMAGYVHGLITPFYYSSNSAVVSMCKSLGSLEKIAGISNVAICPGVVDTPIFLPWYS
ncbi:hypothetical protein CORC01_05284 [Colletotrichum orchidophilum]|uniref:Uncharacterized protein n=1 Tax=Colletotrichum orchidophilum TaxID=1209926 RepID=A0A1G4BDK2_9PEZI|nr:uncharacterized protein CORC01_05284 [Colletotrichum orchidophilum]OHE99484.1 hypothetical protein CORC01_05284 [Colletotrichum orchidophilum]